MVVYFAGYVDQHPADTIGTNEQRRRNKAGADDGMVDQAFCGCIGSAGFWGSYNVDIFSIRLSI